MSGQSKGTEVYGASDDLIEFDGDVHGEVGFYADDQSALAIFSDGTVLEIRYGKAKRGIWAITLVRQGDLFREIVTCDDEDVGRYSDTAHFKPGLKWAYAAKEWEKAQ